MAKAAILMLALVAGQCYGQGAPGVLGGRLPVGIDPKNPPFGLPTFQPCERESTQAHAPTHSPHSTILGRHENKTGS